MPSSASHALRLAPTNRGAALRVTPEDEARAFASAFEHAAVGMVVLTADSRPLRVNRALCDMLGYTEAQMLTHHITDISHPEDAARDLYERHLLLTGVKPTYQREKRYLHRNGHVVWTHLTCTLVRDEAGDPMHFICQAVDITERKLAQQRLQEAQALLHMAAQIGKLGAFASGRGHDSVLWSPEVCAILEVTPGWVPTREEALQFFVPADRDAIRAHLRRCVRDGTPFDAEALAITAKGRRLWVRVIGEAEWDPDGEVCRIHGACQDITEAREAAEAAHERMLRLNAQLEEHVRERTAQLEAANRELEAFSYSIAHDLRAPLAAIDGFAHALQESTSTASERAAHCVRRIRAGVKHMGELTDGLLALANLSRTELRRDTVDLAQLARDAVAQLRERAPQRHVDVRIAPALPVRGDARLLAQVMGNLVGNAWKFTSRKDDACIEVGVEPGDDGAPVYFVRDNGAGFDMAWASRLFEAFQRLHSQSEFEGTGIGLAIVHKIVSRHGGSIRAEGRPREGACFRFTLPA